MSEDSKFCPECGKRVGAGAAMCPDCGHMFNKQVVTGKAYKDGSVLSEGLMMIFIGILIELGAPALGFAGAASIVGAVGAFIGVGGMIVELLGFAKISHINAHFRNAWNYYIGAIVCSIGYAITSIIFSVTAVTAIFTGGYGVVIAMLIISIGFTVVLGVLDVLRIRELMYGCADVAAQNADASLTEKCNFAGKFYMITRGILLAITVLVLIFTLATYASLLSSGYNSAIGLGVAAGVFGIILIIISCILLAAQILVIVRIYQIYSKCKTSAYSSGASSSGTFGNAAPSPAKNANDSFRGSANSSSASSASSGGAGANAAAASAAAAGAAAGVAGGASAFGASVAKARAATPAAAKPVNLEKKESVRKESVQTEDPVTMLKNPDVELEFIQSKAGDDDDEKTVLLTGTAPALINVSTGERIEITSDTFTLGRSREKVDFRIENPAVSVTHAKISKSDGKCFIEDMNSSNHTYINGNQLSPGEAAKAQLKDGDIVKLAEVEFKWEEGSPAPAPGNMTDTSGKSGFLARIDKTGEEEQIDKQEITLGRKGGSADIKVGDSNTVGRIHARIRADEEKGRVFIKDEDSANGTFVNGKRLEKGEEVEIKNNDDIMLSDVTVKFKIR